MGLTFLKFEEETLFINLNFLELARSLEKSIEKSRIYTDFLY